MTANADYQTLVKIHDPQLHRLIRGSIGSLGDVRPFRSEIVRATLSPWNDELRWRYLYDDLVALSSVEERRETITLEMLRWMSGEDESALDSTDDEISSSEERCEATTMVLPSITRSDFVFVTYPAFTRLMLITSQRMLQYAVMSGNSHLIVATPKRAAGLLVYAHHAEDLHHLLKISSKELVGVRKTLIRRAAMIRNASLVDLLTKEKILNVDASKDDLIARELIYAAKKNNSDLFSFLLPFACTNDLLKTTLNSAVILNPLLLAKLLNRFTPPQYALNIALRMAIKENNCESFALLMKIPQAKSVEYAVLPSLLAADRQDLLTIVLESNIRCSANILAQILVDHRRESKIALNLLDAHLPYLDVDGAMELILECVQRPETIVYAKRTLHHHRSVLDPLLDRETLRRIIYGHEG